MKIISYFILQDIDSVETTKDIQTIIPNAENDSSNDKSPTEEKSFDILEKMTRRLYECSYCKERFSCTESLKSHTEVHLSEEERDDMSSAIKAQESQSECNQTKANTDLREKFPEIFSRKARIYLERVDETKSTLPDHVQSNGLFHQKEVANGSNHHQSSKGRKGTLYYWGLRQWFLLNYEYYHVNYLEGLYRKMMLIF